VTGGEFVLFVEDSDDLRAMFTELVDVGLKRPCIGVASYEELVALTRSAVVWQCSTSIWAPAGGRALTRTPGFAKRLYGTDPASASHRSPRLRRFSAQHLRDVCRALDHRRVLGVDATSSAPVLRVDARLEFERRIEPKPRSRNQSSRIEDVADFGR
jgi:hypothetical protein